MIRPRSLRKRTHHKHAWTHKMGQKVSGNYKRSPKLQTERKPNNQRQIFPFFFLLIFLNVHHSLGDLKGVREKFLSDLIVHKYLYEHFLAEYCTTQVIILPQALHHITFTIMLFSRWYEHHSQFPRCHLSRQLLEQKLLLQKVSASDLCQMNLNVNSSEVSITS